MATVVATSVPHVASRSDNERVLRVPVRSFAELPQKARHDHARWLARTRTALQRERGTDEADARSLLDARSDFLAELGRTLHSELGTPDLGNKDDPVDELVYIILSRRTREGAYQIAYDALKAKYGTWEELAAAPLAEIEEVVRFSGLGQRKAQSLKLALGALIARFGSCTLEPTRSWDDDETCEFLCALPEIGSKSAACVMMCSLDRPAFPVDAHVGRVLERLGIFRAMGIELSETDHKAKQRLLWDAVPPALRYSLHVNLLVHGRVTCLPRKPRCDSCVIADACAFAAPCTRPRV